MECMCYDSGLLLDMCQVSGGECGGFLTEVIHTFQFSALGIFGWHSVKCLFVRGRLYLRVRVRLFHAS
jgi:hypothetical protein